MIAQQCGGVVTPERIVQLSEEEFSHLVCHGGKQDTIRGIALAFVAGQNDTRELRDAEEDRLIKELIALPGIAIWTGEMLMLHSLQRPDICVCNNFGIRRGMMRLY